MTEEDSGSDILIITQVMIMDTMMDTILITEAVTIVDMIPFTITDGIHR